MTCFHRPPRHWRGFTLIELLVVVAIIAVLIGIALPVVGKLRSQGQLATSVNQLKQIGTAINLYAGEHDFRFPVPSNMVQQDNPDRTHWAQQIARREEYLGPATTFIHQTLVAPDPGYEYPDGGFRDLDDTYLTYSASGTSCGILPGGSLDYTTARKLNEVKDPSASVLVFLARQRGAKDGYARTVHPNFSEIESDLGASSPEQTTVLNFAYNDAMPVLMADGAVRAIRFHERDLLTRERWEGRQP